MNFSVTRGIIDNDPKGLSGRGTKFYMDVTAVGEVVRHEYYLMDVIEGKFDDKPILTKLKATAKAESERRQVEREAAERQRREERLARVQEDPTLIVIINDILSRNAKIVHQVLEGKEKAVNALVGQTIGECKKQSINGDPFVITALINRLISQP